MLNIVGTRIYLHEKDEVSFKVLYRTEEGDLFNFHADDIVTMIISSRDNQILLRKEAISLVVDGNPTAVLTFRYKDYEKISKGDYYYSLEVITASGSRHTVIDKAYLHVVKDKNAAEDLLGDEFIPHRLVSHRNDKVCLSNSPLICNFNCTSVSKQIEQGTLILFNRDNPGSENEDDNSEDDTLILFNMDIEDGVNEDDTLIIF